MQFEISDVIAHPLEVVYPTYRDKLDQLIDYLDDVENIVVLERDDSDPGRIKLLNEWTSGSKVPAFLKPIAKRFDVYQISWLDHALWVQEETCVYWEMEFNLLKEYVSAKGCNTMKADGDKTKITINGELNLDFSKVRLMPKLVIKRLTNQTEKFVLKLIKPNLTKINRGLEQYIEEHPDQNKETPAKSTKAKSRKSK